MSVLCANGTTRTGRRAPRHDRRYAIDCTETELGWRPQKTFEKALEENVTWYLDEAWCRPIREGRYKGERLGLNG